MPRILLALGLAASLSACAADDNPLVQGLRPLVLLMKSPPEPALNPAYRYLRLELNGRPGYMVLGYVDGPKSQPREVWYSADPAMLRLHHGRIVSALGFPTEWRRVEQPGAPSWREAAVAEAPLHWQRVRDVLPGYRFGIRDEMSLKRIPAPEDSALRHIAARSLVWFEERVADSDLPPARYAVHLDGTDGRVVYSEQCLSPTLCIDWQRWPAATAQKQ